MGGIVARKRMKEWISGESSGGMQSYFTHSYSVVRGDHFALGRLKEWGLGHPLKELRLSAEDIKDKSKADWIVKIIAVFQIARLIFDLITRGVGAQPVTQFEIATASFSVFAIVTYLANWWKPKDVSQPTRLDTVIDQGTKGDPAEFATEPFFARLWCPIPPAHCYEDTMSARDRIRNDELWVDKGSFILTWVLMATSCLVFGGIHCIAWSFQFPTQVEQLAWRIAALVSTTLPVIALAGSFAILRYRPQDLKGKQIAAMEDTLDLHWDSVFIAHDNWWHNFMTVMSTSEWDEWVKSHPEQGMIKDMERLRWEVETVGKLRSSTLNLRYSSYGSRDEEKLINDVWNIARSLRTSGGQDIALRGQYEKYVGDGQPDEGPARVFELVFARCALESASVQSYQKVRRDLDSRAQTLSRVLNIICGIIYTAARLVLVAIMFSSLRAVPDGVYDTANWIRFVPNFA